MPLRCQRGRRRARFAHPLLALAACGLAACLHPAGPIAQPAPATPAKAAESPPGEQPPALPEHQTFHYKTDAKPGRFDQWGEGNLDPQTKDRFAEGMRLDCPGPGTLHAETTVEPEGTQLRLAIYVGGPKPLAVTTKGELDARIEKAGPCYVVVSVPSFSWDCSFRVRASFKPGDPPSR